MQKEYKIFFFVILWQIPTSCPQKCVHPLCNKIKKDYNSFNKRASKILLPFLDRLCSKHINSGISWCILPNILMECSCKEKSRPCGLFYIAQANSQYIRFY